MSEPGRKAGVAVSAGPTLGEVREDCKAIVVSIDFGTAYSGTAFAMKASPERIKYATPTAENHQVKVPTVLLELGNDVWLFGNDALTEYNRIMQNAGSEEIPSAHLYKGFKMVLKGKEAGFDTLEAESTTGKHQPLMNLVAKCLQFLMNGAIPVLKSESEYEDLTGNIQWVLTVPAIWNDFGKAFMRKAAFQAGLIDSEQSDALTLVLEPESAALAVHVSAAQHHILGLDSRFMVLDCGGGTIDITVHEVVGESPLRMHALAVPTGSAWGGETVDAQFRSFLQELLGPELFDERGSQAPSFHLIYKTFDHIKCSFDPESRANPAPISLTAVLHPRDLLVALAEEWNAKHPEKTILLLPNLRNAQLTMSRELMLSFFAPAVDATIADAKRVLTVVPDIQYLIVVGGFGSSKVLTRRVRDAFHCKNGVQVILPDGQPKPQAAIVHGAVHFGLYKDIITSRIAAYTYGLELRNRETNTPHVFHVLVRRGDALPIDQPITFELEPVTLTQPHVVWKLYRSEDVSPVTTIGEHLLGSVEVPVPPGGTLAERRLRASFCFGGTEIAVSSTDRHGTPGGGKVSYSDSSPAS